MGVPFVAVRGLLGSDMLAYRPDLLVPGQPLQARRTGGGGPTDPGPMWPFFTPCKPTAGANAITPGPRDDVMLARAARRVIVTAETVVDTRLSPADAAHDTFLPAIDVDVVAEAPLGAHPCGLGRLYEHDPDHCRTYLAAAAQPHEFHAYLDRYVFGVADHAAYLSRVDATRRAGV